jgi:5-methylcytosine-specific restriction enzyme subunit McrC
VPEVQLREADQPQLVEMATSVALALNELQVASVRPSGTDGAWLVDRVSRVGAVRLGNTIVRIAPKIPISSLFHMLGFTDWDRYSRPGDVTASESDFHAVVARSYADQLRRALRRGLVQGYRTYQEAGFVVRGRINMARQLSVGRGLTLPVHVEYDEYGPDTPINRLLLTALRRLIRLGGLNLSLYADLLTLEADFDGVTELPRNAVADTPEFTRLTEHLREVTGLAVLIIGRRSLDEHEGDRVSSGLLLSMPAVFEDFVRGTLDALMRARGGRILKPPHSSLDVDGGIRVQPDLLAVRERMPLAVLDAKYKREHPSGYPNADIYQAIVYARHYGMADAHLIYGQGSAATYEIASAGVTVHCHALDLSAPPGDVEAQLGHVLTMATGRDAD